MDAVCICIGAPEPTVQYSTVQYSTVGTVYTEQTVHSRHDVHSAHTLLVYTYDIA